MHSSLRCLPFREPFFYAPDNPGTFSFILAMTEGILVHKEAIEEVPAFGEEGEVFSAFFRRSRMCSSVSRPRL